MRFTAEQKKNREEWVQQLRSGKRRQGEGYLRYYTSGGLLCHCCLGVAAEDVLDQMFRPRLSGSSVFMLVGTPLLDGKLPYELEQLLGINSYRFIYMNDIMHFDFDQIADYIEKETRHGQPYTEVGGRRVMNGLKRG